MAKICGKWRIYLGIGLSDWETAKIFGKWRRSAGKCLKYVGKWLHYLSNLLKCRKWLRDLGNGQNIWEMA